MSYQGKVLTIAGSDSGGGAGVQADLKTFQAFDVFGMSVITCVTAQNTLGVRSTHDVPAEIVADQIDAVMKDMGAEAVKTGMLSNAGIIGIVVDRIKKYRIAKLAVDPVMVAKSGVRLLKEDAQDTLTNELLPLAFVVTPNLQEAEVISGVRIKDVEGAKRAAKIIYKKGAKNVLIKGGHLPGEKAVDILFDGKDYKYYSSEKISTKNTHGTGCTHSAAIAASLSKGLNIYQAVEVAKDYITEAIKNAPSDIGGGYGPLYHNNAPMEISAFTDSAGRRP